MALSISRIETDMRLTLKRRSIFRHTIVALLLVASVFVLKSNGASAITPIVQPPKGDSFGVEMTIPGPPPTQGATITVPSNGQSFTELPVRIAGICPKDLLVKIMINDVFAGSMYCTAGTFSLQASLYTGQNDIKALVFDNLDQPGPESNVVSVSYNNATFSAFGTLITLTSPFARRAAAPGSTLTWPLVLSGGTGPYAFSIDWGDGTTPELKSQTFSGNIDIKHVYKNAGVYQVVIKVTDTNGVSAFLQLTAVATGTPVGGVTVAPDKNNGTPTIKKIILWQPAVVMLILAIAAFWLGQRYELSALRKQIERDAEKYTA
jgi:hypothetical protein